MINRMDKAILGVTDAAMVWLWDEAGVSKINAIRVAALLSAALSITAKLDASEWAMLACLGLILAREEVVTKLFTARQQNAQINTMRKSLAWSIFRVSMIGFDLLSATSLLFRGDGKSSADMIALCLLLLATCAYCPDRPRRPKQHFVLAGAAA